VALLIPLAVAASTTTAALAIIVGPRARVPMVLLCSRTSSQLIGLGAGLRVDYSLLIVHRFRHELADEERTGGRSAIVATMQVLAERCLSRASRFAIGLSVVLIVPVPFVRSLGFAGLVCPACLGRRALTLQPSLLSLLGPPRHAGTVSASVPGQRVRGERGLWSRLAAQNMSHAPPDRRVGRLSCRARRSGYAGCLDPAHTGVGCRVIIELPTSSPPALWPSCPIRGSGPELIPYDRSLPRCALGQGEPRRANLRCDAPDPPRLLNDPDVLCRAIGFAGRPTSTRRAGTVA